jgi:hypothetical protein
MFAFHFNNNISSDIFDAMFMVKHQADEVIIQQGKRSPSSFDLHFPL